MILAAIIATGIGALLAVPASKLVFHFLSLSTIAFGEIICSLIQASPGEITGNFRGYFPCKIVIFGVNFCLRGEMTSGEFIAFMSYNGMLVWPVRQLGRMISDMSKAGVSMDRIGAIMDAEEEKNALKEFPIYRYWQA